MNDPRPLETRVEFGHHLPQTLTLEEALGPERREPPPRRWRMATFLFLATCASLFLVGFNQNQSSVTAAVVYMACVMAILLTHELGHFLQSVRYGVPASLPYFIPFPSFIGTMGAVIVQYDFQENRKQLFDIGLSGPIAGLFVAIPLTAWGVTIADPVSLVIQNDPSQTFFGDPLLVTWLTWWIRPELGYGRQLYFNPPLQAGWFGLLLTGLNMMPLGQLDGGHVSHAVFRQNAGTIARVFILAAIAYMVFSGNYQWVIMAALVLVIGLDHPPTIDDDLPLDPVRTVLGVLSFAIPIVCFTPAPFPLG